MPTYEFVCKEHHDHGFNGWVLKSKPYFDPAAGMQLAHDVFEEFPNGQDQPHDEFLALGASLFTRGEGGFFSYRGWHENIAADFPEIFRHVEHESGYVLRSAPKTRKCEDWVEESYIQPLIQELNRTLAKAKESQDDDFESEMLIKNEWYLSDAINWIRIGYRRAKKRYRYLDSCTLSYLFQELQNKADKFLERAELGDVLKVRFNARRGRLDVFHFESWELEGGYY